MPVGPENASSSGSSLPDELWSLAGTTIAVMMNASMESVLIRAFLAAKYYGYNFNMTEIPAGVDVGKDPLAFDPTQMRAGFDAGRALAKQPNPWKQTPPTSATSPPG